MNEVYIGRKNLFQDDGRPTGAGAVFQAAPTAAQVLSEAQAALG